MAQHFKQLGRRQQKPPMHLGPTALVNERKPRRDEQGEIDLFILGLMDGSASNEEIALKTANNFSRRLISYDNALSRVYELVEDYDRKLAVM